MRLLHGHMTFRHDGLVCNTAVMSARALAVHRVITFVAGILLLALGTIWIAVVLDGEAYVSTAFVVLFVAAYLGSSGVRWALLPRMMRPVAMAPSVALRVAAVTTFVPTHEPLDMLERSLLAMLRMHEPHDTWVLDESDSAEVRALCEHLGVRHFSRASEPNYNQDAGTFRIRSKHGNYNAWCAHHGFAEYDVLAMFDPDHVPDVNYLRQTLGYLTDGRVGFVQTPQVYYNQAASFVARGAAEESYAYYSTHLMASYALGHTVVIGSHGVHRLAALRDVGGLPAHDAEDLYLTMLYRTAGWRGVFVPDVLAMGQTPTDWSSYLRQQLRWARSLLDLKFRVLPALAVRLTPRERIANLLHGGWFLRSLALPVLYALLAVHLVTNTAPAYLRPEAMLALFALVLVPLSLGLVQHRYYLPPDRLDRFHWRGAAMQFAKWPVLMRAAVEAASGRVYAYALTSKRAGPATSSLLAPVHTAVAVIVAIAWSIGVKRFGALHAELTIAAASVICLSLAIVASDLFPRVAAMTSDLHESRRAAAARSYQWSGRHEAV